MLRMGTNQPAHPAVGRDAPSRQRTTLVRARVIRLPPAASTVAAATATTATTIPPAATATPSTVAAAPATAATTEAAASLGPVFRLVHAEGTPVERRTVHCLNRFLSLRRRSHRHEAEAARLTRSAVRDDVDIGDFADSCKRFAHRLDRGRERQVADIKTRPHEYLFSLVAATNPRSHGSAFTSCLPSKQPRNQEPGRDGAIRRFPTLRNLRARSAIPCVERASLPGETSVSMKIIAGALPGARAERQVDRATVERLTHSSRRQRTPSPKLPAGYTGTGATFSHNVSNHTLLPSHHETVPPTIR